MEHNRQLIASGGTADVYEYGPGRVLKLYRSSSDQHNADREFQKARILFECGFPSPTPFEQVEVDGLPGIVFERLKGESLLSLFFADPTGCMKISAEFMSRFHRLNTDNTPSINQLPRLKEELMSFVRIADYLTEDERDKIRTHITSLPDLSTLSHGDFNPTNIMLVKGQPILIDFVSLSLGSPMYDVMQMCALWKYVVLDSRFKEDQKVWFEAWRDRINQAFLSEYDRINPINEEELERWFIPVATERLNKYNNIPEQQKLKLLTVLRERLNQQ